MRLKIEFEFKLFFKDGVPLYSRNCACLKTWKKNLSRYRQYTKWLHHRSALLKTCKCNFRRTKIERELQTFRRSQENFLSDDYNNNNHPVSTFSDAAHYLTGKQLLCELDCWQECHCLQTAHCRLTRTVQRCWLRLWWRNSIQNFWKFSTYAIRNKIYQ